MRTGAPKPRGSRTISTANCVLDASALLALLLGEAGGDGVDARMKGACISTVNLCEVVTKLIDRGASETAMQYRIETLKLDVREFDQHLAIRAGLLRSATRAQGLSLGDRACLALAESLGLPAITTDKAWGKLDIGITIEVVR